MENTPNSGPRAEAKPSASSVHCFSLSVQKMVQGELGSIGSKTGGGVEGLTANKTPAHLLLFAKIISVIPR